MQETERKLGERARAKTKGCCKSCRSDSFYYKGCSSEDYYRIGKPDVLYRRMPFSTQNGIKEWKSCREKPLRDYCSNAVMNC